VPEGDTIHRVAARLRPALEGRRLVRFEAPRLAGSRPRPGETVDAVEAVGKHLLVRFSGGLTLETHLRMTGSWDLYRTGERWRKPRHLLRCRIEVPGHVAVCWSAPVVRTFATAATGTAADPTAHLGPDLAAPLPAGAEDLDAEVVAICVGRMGAVSEPGRAIGDVLLDQRVANGVGNVYRSEVCWACRVSPFLPLSSAPDALRVELVRTAGRLLRANLDRPGRSTVPGGGLTVYGRRGRACRRCGTSVRSGTAAEYGRVVYWCPTCQPEP
jgi:endonuclease-8